MKNNKKRINEGMIKKTNKQRHDLIVLLLQPVEYEELTSERNSYLAGVVVLCVFMAIIIILLLLCCFCPGCPLYKDR